MQVSKTIENLKEWLKPRLPAEKYFHSLGVQETARELAEMFNVDKEKASLAGLLHDNAKSMTYQEMLDYLNQENISLEEDIKSNRKILHAYIGAYKAFRELNIGDLDVLDSIKYHTTGRPDMSVMEKIIYISDKIEPNSRDLEFRAKVMNTLKEDKGLDKAVLIITEATIISLLERKLVINSITIDVWNYYTQKTK